MNFRDRVLYHQIHPLKLATDWGAGIVAAGLLWQHRLVLALLVGFVPPVLVSAVLLRFGDLRRQRNSRLGRYVARFMTRRLEAARLVGLVIFWTGAWLHRWPFVLGGIALIVGCWLWGLVPLHRSSRAETSVR